MFLSSFCSQRISSFMGVIMAACPWMTTASSWQAFFPNPFQPPTPFQMQQELRPAGGRSWQASCFAPASFPGQKGSGTSRREPLAMTRAPHLERERSWGRPVRLTRLPGSGPPALSLRRVHSAAGEPRKQSALFPVSLRLP